MEVSDAAEGGAGICKKIAQLRCNEGCGSFDAAGISCIAANMLVRYRMIRAGHLSIGATNDTRFTTWTN